MQRAKAADGLEFRDSHRALVRCWEIMADGDILPGDKTAGCHLLLFGRLAPQDEMDRRMAAFFALWRKPSARTGERVFDFLHDYDLVYAAFRQTYGIDIEDEDLPIAKFLALFDGLPDGTRLAETIALRARKPPRRTKDNGDYIAALTRAKQAVALPSAGWGDWRRTLAVGIGALAGRNP